MNDEVKCHYATTRNLAARGSFQGKYATVNWFEWLTATMALAAGSDVLDLGCGPAWYWKTQAQALPEGLVLSLFDISPGMIAEAEKNLSTIDCLKVHDARVGDATDLPYADASFDVVLLLHVLYHVSDPEQALLEARRVLRPGGRVILSANTTDSMSELHQLGAAAYGGDPVDPGAALFSLDDGEAMVKTLFTRSRRHDLTDVMACTDPEDAVAFLLSMPPGNTASDAECAKLKSLLRDATERSGGVLKTTRRNGTVEGIKPG